MLIAVGSRRPEWYQFIVVSGGADWGWGIIWQQVTVERVEEQAFP